MGKNLEIETSILRKFKEILLKEIRLNQRANNFHTEDYKDGLKQTLWLLNNFIDKEILGIQTKDNGLSYFPNGERVKDIGAKNEL